MTSNAGTDWKAIKEFMQLHYRHFNAATVVDAASSWVDHLNGGGRMFLSMAGAMSTAELGISLAEMIRQDRVHAISCTGANLEEDIFNLVAHDHYKRIPDWRALTAEQEQELFDQGLNRVTDTCIPEDEAMRFIDVEADRIWIEAGNKGERLFPHELVYRMLRSGNLEERYQIDPKNSWLIAAAEKDLPIFVPGWEDSTLGNSFVASVMLGTVQDLSIMRSGLEYMRHLVNWYRETTTDSGYGFFQIGGGIAGDFSICAVPLITQDLREPARLWDWFCQISDSTTSYGSYSGAVPNEKITWGKLSPGSPKFIIESDATIVAPLIFAYVLASLD